MSTLSLLSSPWLPVRRRSGARARIPPSDITSAIDRDPIVALDWPRPDFDLACRELLVGLFALAGHREASEEEAWVEWWRRPPSPADLSLRLQPFAPAFLLDGSGPRFLQDFAQLSGQPEEIGKLLIEAPGAQTLARNIDLFVKRGGVQALGRAAAAMALFTLQDFAPSGGKGNRTSLRGGGPLVTLVLAEGEEGEPSLWHQLWLNVVWEKDWPEPNQAQLPRIFLGSRRPEPHRTTRPRLRRTRTRPRPISACRGGSGSFSKTTAMAGRAISPARSINESSPVLSNAPTARTTLLGATRSRPTTDRKPSPWNGCRSIRSPIGWAIATGSAWS